MHLSGNIIYTLPGISNQRPNFLGYNSMQDRKMNKFQWKDIHIEVKVDVRNQSQNIRRHVSRATYTATMY